MMGYVIAFIIGAYCGMVIISLMYLARKGDEVMILCPINGDWCNKYVFDEDWKLSCDCELINDSEKTNGEFEGEGLCEKKNIRVDACDHCNDDFKCFRLIKGNDAIKKLPRNGKGQ